MGIPQLMQVVGTAGHVDHGKSTLIHALTGIDPDRLQEEKERGMTIDLGFAWLTLPNGVEVSIVDVPGHERFIHNMLAGVAGIDIALLVVAADEGIMPQTREHLAILDLLEVGNGLVALTKADLVDEEWLQLVQIDVEDTLAGTALAGAPVVACSSVTGEGLDRLKEVLQDRLQRGRPRARVDRLRLPIDRVFTVAGFGTVVTGTLVEGELRLGQELEVQPGGLRTRVRGLQSHRKKLEVVSAGTRAAVNVGGLAVEQLRRGQVLARPGTLRPTRAVDARLRLVKDALPLAHNAEITFHVGAAESLGRVSLLDRDELQPGEEGWVQIRLRDEVALDKGDLFVVRLPSPSRTLGGGRVVEPHARRHRRNQEAVLRQLAVLARGSPREMVLAQLGGRGPLEVGALARQTGLPLDDVRSATRELAAENQIVVLPGGPSGGRDGRADVIEPRTLVLSAAGWADARARLDDILGSFHRSFPLRQGMAREEVRTRLGLEARAFVHVLERLKEETLVAEDGPWLRLPDHQVRLSADQERQAEQLVQRLRQAGVAMPDRTEIEQQLGVAPELTDLLIARGDVVQVSTDLIYDRETIERLVEQVRTAARERGSITVAQIRDLLGASRKYALALAAYMDERKITRRIGDERVLNAP